MEYAFVLSKSRHTVTGFFKQEFPTDIAPKWVNVAIVLTNKTNVKASMSQISAVMTTKQERPIKMYAETVNSTEKFRRNLSLEASKESTEDPDLLLLEMSRNGQLKDAVSALDSLARSGYKVKPETYLSLLQSCVDFDSIHEGREIHARISSVREVNPFVVTRLVSMYAKCGSLKDARRVFTEMCQRNLFTWSAMIGGYAREQKWEEVIELFVLMLEEGVTPDGFLLPKIIQACANLGEVETGKVVHSFAIRRGLFSFIQITNTLVAMYMKCGKLDFARNIFENSVEKDLVTWNAMISGYCQNGDFKEGLNLFEKMKIEGIKPGLVTWNILLNSYSQLGDCDVALELMKKMKKSGICPDVFSWTSMISGLARNNRTHQALDLFKEMLVEGVQPNGMTVASALSACASLKAFRKGMEIHSVAFKVGSVSNILVGNSLIDLYSKCGKLEAARRVFNNMTDKDVFTWNSMIAGYAQGGYCGKAHELFMKMEDSGIQKNVVTCNAMISCYMQNGDEDQALELFHQMEEEGIKWSAATWNSLITGSVKNGNESKAWVVFRQMQSFGMRPNAVSILSVLPAVENIVSGPKVKEIHGYVIRSGLIFDIPVANSLLDAYTKSGYILYARSVFDCLSPKGIISWNSILYGYALHGQPNLVIDLFHRMPNEGARPNHTTFAHLISAYGLAGMIDEGKNAFLSMTKNHQIWPSFEHYVVMVALWGRSGRLEEAVEFIEQMPMKPGVEVWATLLSACRVHGDINLAICAAEHLFKLEPGDPVLYKMLVRMYSLVGRPDDALGLGKLKKRNVAANVGVSRIEVNCQVYTFSNGDRSFPNSNAIYSFLGSLHKKMKSTGSDFCNAQIHFEEEENLGTHSEMLAMAFALIHSPTYRSIRMNKNLTMCVACHNVAKFLSSLYGREIIIRDPNCLHYFRKGQCSCRDYW